MTQQRQQFVSWLEIQYHVEGLASLLPDFPLIYGIPRNGTIIAGLLSHCRTDIQLVPTLPLDPNEEGNNRVVIVDDIHDTGTTLEPYIYAGFKTAVLYYRVSPEKRSIPGVYAESICHKDYLVFPWEEEGRKWISAREKVGPPLR
jgi:hypoxanthine phosphoribosyltransferase